MKKFFERLALYLIFVAILYGVHSLIALDLNPLEWPWILRLIGVLLVLYLSYLLDNDDANM